MKNLLSLLLLAFVCTGLRAENAAAANDKVIAAVRAADDARVAASVAVDREKLNAVYSNELRYAHSSGKIDTKASFIASLVSKEAVYFAVDYQERNFVPVAPGIVLMNGRGSFKVSTGGAPRQDLDLRFLAVWREEQGTWRMIAWQSNRQPAAAPAK